MRISQRAIARELGISQATVSLVLNNADRGRVSQETREKILAFLGEKQMQGSPGLTLICTVPGNASAENATVTRLLLAVETEVARIGHRIVVHRLQDDERVSETLRAAKADGAILIDDIPDDTGDIECPLVLLNVDVDPLPCDVIQPDYRGATRMVVEALAVRGHSRIAFLGDDSCRCERMDPRLAQRLGGYAEGLARMRIEIRDEYIALYGLRGNPPTESMDLRASLQALRDLPAPPTAIIAYNTVIAAEALREADSLGISIPKDISLIGMDDLPMCEFLKPRLSSVAHDLDAVAREGVRCLFERIEKTAPAYHRRVLIPSSLIQRDSIA